MSIVLDFRPRAGVKLDQDKDWMGRLTGTVWIDRADKTLVRIEGKTASGGINESKKAYPVRRIGFF